MGFVNWERTIFDWSGLSLSYKISKNLLRNLIWMQKSIEFHNCHHNCTQHISSRQCIKESTIHLNDFESTFFPRKLRFTELWSIDDYLQASIGSIFLVPSPLSTKAGRKCRTSGSSKLGRYRLICQLNSGKIWGI